LGITQSRVRQHLRTLLRYELVEVAFARMGGPGPRERVWRPTPKGQWRVRPQKTGSFLVLFLQITRRRAGKKIFAELLQETAHLLAQRRHPNRDTPLSERIALLRDLLDELAVASRLEEAVRIYRLHLLTPSPWEISIAASETEIFYRTLAEDLLEVQVEPVPSTDLRQAIHTYQFPKTLN